MRCGIDGAPVVGRVEAGPRADAPPRVRVANFGTALRFQPSVANSCRVALGNRTFLDGLPQFSFFAWAQANPAGVSPSGRLSMFGYQFFYGGNRGYAFAALPGNRLAFVAGSAFSTVGVGGNLCAPNHLGFTLNAAGLLLFYMNGAPVGSMPGVGKTRRSDPNNGTNLGNETPSGSIGPGVIDKARLWGRELSPVEVAALYNADVVPARGLVFNFEFDEGQGATVADSSGNGHDGTLSGDVPPVWVPSFQ